MKKKLLGRLAVLALLVATSIPLYAQNKQKPLVIARQGSFAIGGKKVTEPGTFDLNNALKPQGTG